MLTLLTCEMMPPVTVPGTLEWPVSLPCFVGGEMNQSKAVHPSVVFRTLLPAAGLRAPVGWGIFLPDSVTLRLPAAWGILRAEL